MFEIVKLAVLSTLYKVESPFNTEFIKWKWNYFREKKKKKQSNRDSWRLYQQNFSFSFKGHR